jgi:hypothetical protein
MYFMLIAKENPINKMRYNFRHLTNRVISPPLCDYNGKYSQNKILHFIGGKKKKIKKKLDDHYRV